MNTLTYKGYTTKVEFDVDDRIFIGRLMGIRDVIGFHGETFAEFETVFKETVDDYLQTCEQQGWEPNKPASGKLMLRIMPEVHASAMRAAQIAGKSLNKWAEGVLREAVKE